MTLFLYYLLPGVGCLIFNGTSLGLVHLPWGCKIGQGVDNATLGSHPVVWGLVVVNAELKIIKLYIFKYINCKSVQRLTQSISQINIMVFCSNNQDLRLELKTVNDYKQSLIKWQFQWWYKMSPLNHKRTQDLLRHLLFTKQKIVNKKKDSFLFDSATFSVNLPDVPGIVTP